MHAGQPSTIPRGWALMDGTSNGSSVGGSGIDMRSRFVVCYDPTSPPPSYGDTVYQGIGTGAAGGTKTHSHASHTQSSSNIFYTGGGVVFTDRLSSLTHDTQDHRPPFMVLAFIERQVRKVGCPQPMTIAIDFRPFGQ